MRKNRLLSVGMIGLVIVVMVFGAGCQKDYRFFEAAADSMVMPETIKAGEDLKVILSGALLEYTPEPTIDRIEYAVSANLVDIKVIVREPIGQVAVPACWPWVDTVYVKNLTRSTYEIKNGSLVDTVVVR